MDKITKYRNIIKQVLKRHKSSGSNPKKDRETQIIFDDENGHYLLMGVGWDKFKRIHGITIHIDLKGDKIWIQQDWTDPCVADLLEEMGVPKSDIVLAFHAPYRRKFIEEYAPG
jgi:hypothetical protein